MYLSTRLLEQNFEGVRPLEVESLPATAARTLPRARHPQGPLGEAPAGCTKGDQKC